MNGCNAMQAEVYGVSGRPADRARDAAHRRPPGRLPGVRRRMGSAAAECRRRWHRSGPVPEPEDLLLRIRVAVSQERARRRKSVFEAWGLAWKNTVGPFCCRPRPALPARCCCWARSSCWWACLPSRRWRRPKGTSRSEWPLRPACFISPAAPATATRSATFPARWWWRPISTARAGVRLPHRLRSHRCGHPRAGGKPAAVQRFEPARFFGQPVRGLAVLSFSGVSVRGR